MQRRQDIKLLKPVFVDSAPENLDEGTIYISIKHSTALHRCCCGCGTEVVTPLDPTDWTLIYDGKTISLWPSIGNWGLNCRSHYWIRRNRVAWASDWTQAEVNEARKHDRSNLELMYGILEDKRGLELSSASVPEKVSVMKKGFFRRLFGL